MIGNHFADGLIEEVKSGKQLQGTGDNRDMVIHVRDMQSSHQNVDLHYFASNLIVERVPCQNLSIIAPRKDVRSLPNSVFRLSNEESAKLREDFRVLVGRVLVDGIPDLSSMRSISTTHTSQIPERNGFKVHNCPSAHAA